MEMKSARYLFLRLTEIINMREIMCLIYEVKIIKLD